ncbi:guanylate-binding 1-like protein [Labeo rohita]|uniref:Guanylate-binding 1-like protein n=1 Tax=Labeo rohita TaxID=84645 RepID=A0A498LIE8_LABRO|nr:guanylate-binding 1-like protein [Labeo rohita]
MSQCLSISLIKEKLKGDMSKLEKAIVAIVEVFEEYAGTDDQKKQLSNAELGQLIKAQITSPEFKDKMDSDNIKEVMEELDKNHDGEVNFREFSISHRIEQYNLPRRCLRQFFAVRKCFVFPRPASTQNMQRMEQLTEKELDSGFLGQADTFCSYVYDNSEPKTVTGGRTITGTALGNLAEVYVEAIRSGNVLCVENAVTCLAKIQNVRAVEEALQFYMTEMLSIAELPKRPEELSDIHKTAEKKAIEVFFSISFNDNGQIYQQELMRKIHDEYQQRCQQNQEASRMQCEDVLRDVFDKMEKSISDGSYLKPGGYQQYRDTLTQLTWDYRARTDSQIMKSQDKPALDKIFKDLDANKDGTVDFQEYITLVACITMFCNEFFQK